MSVTPPRYRRDVGRWRPWRALRDRPDVDFVLADFPPGPVRALYVHQRDKHLILIDRSLCPAERLAALAHELAHIERGGAGHAPGLPDGLATLVAREEHRVDAIVACRLVPADELAAFVDRRSEVGPVTTAMVGDEFGVPEQVAERAMQSLLNEQRRSA